MRAPLDPDLAGTARWAAALKSLLWSGRTAAVRDAARATRSNRESAAARAARYLRAAVYTGLATALAYWLHVPPDLSAEALVMILGVGLTALHCGTGPSVFAAVASVAAFNFFFTEPRFTFRVDDPLHVVAFVVMLLAGLAISSLVNQVQERAETAQQRERETRALYSLTRELADAATDVAVARVAVAHLADAVGGDIAVLATGEQGGSRVLARRGGADWPTAQHLAAAQWCAEHREPVGQGTDRDALFLPLATQRARGAVLALRPAEAMPVTSGRRRLLVDTFAEQAALAFERLLVAEERDAERRQAETERLRTTLLASVSHDLRTPLATITGAASVLVDANAARDEHVVARLARSILEQSRRLEDLVANLMFATRLEAGGVELRKDWTAIEEIVGAALDRAQDQLRAHEVALRVDAGLPLLEADPVLLEQALYLLLENAGRHTPAGTKVQVGAWAEGPWLFVEVADDGPGIPEAERAHVFDRFVRGARSTGMGLGLAICAGIFQAHGGDIRLECAARHGALFRGRLPLPARQPVTAAAEGA